MWILLQGLIALASFRSTLGIAGGEPTSPHQYPWQGVIRFQNVARESWCGGTLIHTRHVASARHCAAIDTYEIDVALAMHDLNDLDTMLPNDPRIYFAADGLGHPSYSPDPGLYYPYDFGLIRLDRDIDASDSRMRAIALPASNAPDYAGMNCVVSGWGVTCLGCSTARFLHHGAQLIRTPADCQEAWSPAISNYHICGGGVFGATPCSGDSGGPLMCQVGATWTLVGTVSLGESGCADGRPSIFARTSAMRAWIDQIIGSQ